MGEVSLDLVHGWALFLRVGAQGVSLTSPLCTAASLTYIGRSPDPTPGRRPGPSGFAVPWSGSGPQAPSGTLRARTAARDLPVASTRPDLEKHSADQAPHAEDGEQRHRDGNSRVGVPQRDEQPDQDEHDEAGQHGVPTGADDTPRHG